jgi:ATP-dependent Lon protease
LPKRNERDLKDVPEEVRKSLKFIFVENVDEVLREALDVQLPKPPPPVSSFGTLAGRPASC